MKIKRLAASPGLDLTTGIVFAVALVLVLVSLVSQLVR